MRYLHFQKTGGATPIAKILGAQPQYIKPREAASMTTD